MPCVFAGARRIVKKFAFIRCLAQFLQTELASACVFGFLHLRVLPRIFCMTTSEKPTHEELARCLKALGQLIKAESQRLEAIHALSNVGPGDFLRLQVESARLQVWSEYFAQRRGEI